MPSKRAKTRRGYSTHISLKPGTVDILTGIKDEFRTTVYGKVTWGSFLEQSALLFESANDYSLKFNVKIT